jgi:hypothetical protein
LNPPAEEKIPETVRRFIIEHINSVEALEILLLLFNAQSDEWSATEVSRKLCTSVESATARLNELQLGKLLLAISADPVKYRFNSGDDQLIALVGELEKVYKERRVSVISLIYSKPSEPLRAFADAFRLRKEGK